MYRDHTLASFLNTLASASPEPGGGAAAALTGALAAALVGMVANLTIGKEKYADAQAEMIAAQASADALRMRLTEAIDRDSEAFRAVIHAYGLPRATDDEKAARRAAIQEALKAASREPAEVVRCCHEIAELSRAAAEKGNPQAVSDAACAAVLADAAAQGAALNVRINLKSITDPAFTSALWAGVQADLDGIRALRDTVTRITDGRLG